jgi:hypothetical protein
MFASSIPAPSSQLVQCPLTAITVHVMCCSCVFLILENARPQDTSTSSPYVRVPVWCIDPATAEVTTSSRIVYAPAASADRMTAQDLLEL